MLLLKVNDHIDGKDRKRMSICVNRLQISCMHPGTLLLPLVRYLQIFNASMFYEAVSPIMIYAGPFALVRVAFVPPHLSHIVGECGQFTSTSGYHG